ncbi:hypothetical protein PVBG_05554 [Plasmodium vivax Brazil I]|uniref:Uncharacterized protein n=1 Tax=Plasmodium vivax (strain Brazil I) TaxID=1033975 RepID=A0A0J9VNE9_PLAV1|nr:hypothetical protein PVBG_05554 [Plasmodium vivax Brazil I]
MGQEEPDCAVFEDFNIFETIEIYIKENYESNVKAAFCESLDYESNTNPDLQLVNTCKRFVTLFDGLIGHCTHNVDELNKKKYPEYMNFWLNYQLFSSAYNKKQKLKFHNELASKYSNFKAESILNNKMFVMDDKYFRNMSIVYKLYKMLYIETERKNTKCDEFLEDFKKLYNEGIKKCYIDGDINLSKELEKFKDLYMKNDLNNVNFCIRENIPILPELSLLESSDKTKLRISNIASELLQSNSPNLVDKLPKIYYNDLKDLISVHYNLLFEYKKEEQNCLMIRILHQFFQYCNENKDNQKLASFMKEFIDEYYKKHKEEYKKIFEECKGEGKSNKYCDLFNTWKRKFKTDLSLIQNKPDSYLDYMKKYINGNTADTSSIANTLSMFLDFAANSKYSTTIISIMISFFLCFFFLYKVLNNYIYKIYLCISYN